jgi:DNA repair photolyase
VPFEILGAEARSILTPVSGFLLDAGFTHSLSPARNCTFGCSYCYVPTMRIQAGLRPDDWKHWGERTTFKRNAPDLLRKSLRPDQIIYCSPLTDPYQPAEETERLMLGIVEAVIDRPPAVFVLQTRGPLILRDVDLLREAAKRTRLRIGFSVTTDQDEVRKIFEPHCASIEQRWQTVAALRDAGIEACTTLAPVLPCDPERLIAHALSVSDGPIIADPFHVRSVKKSGATTREAAAKICARHNWSEWLDPHFQQTILDRMRHASESAGRVFEYGTKGFGLLAATRSTKAQSVR